MKPRHHGTNRAVEHGRDLAVRQSLDVTQHDNGSRVGRQGIERLADARPALGAFGHLVGTHSGIGGRALPFLLRHRLIAEGARLSPARSEPIGRHVHGDAKQPGIEGRLATKGSQRLKGPHEGVLSAIPCLLAIAEHLVGQAPHALTVFLHQGLEGLDVPRPASIEERALVDIGRARRRRGVRRRRRDGRRRHGRAGRPPRVPVSSRLDAATPALIHRARRAGRPVAASRAASSPSK